MPTWRHRNGQTARVPDDTATPKLPDGVTRFDVPRVTTWRRPADHAVTVATAAGALLGLGGLLLGASPGAVLVALVVGWAVVVATCLVPGVWKVVVAGVGLTVGAATVGGSGDGAALAPLAAGAFAGVPALAALSARRDRRRRLASAVGAPAVDRDPRDGRDVGTLATWRDAVHEYEAADPDPEVVVDALRRLDAADHVYVSIYRGRGRLDVYGGADEALVVQQTDDRRLTGGHWNVAIDPAYSPDGASGERVEVGWAGHYADRGRTVGLRQAESAVRTWLAHGVRDRDLTWHRLRRDEAHPQPSPLRRTD